VVVPILPEAVDVAVPAGAEGNFFLRHAPVGLSFSSCPFATWSAASTTQVDPAEATAATPLLADSQ